MLYADVIAPFVWFWPGIVSISFVYAFPASLLAAFVERPFLSLAGVNQRPLMLSLRANFVSAIVGILLSPIGNTVFYTYGILWCLIAFAISCLVEIYYLRFFFRVGVWWIILGNAISSGLLMATPPIALVLEQNHHPMARALEPHETWMNITAVCVSLVVFLASFRQWPLESNKSTQEAGRRPQTEDRSTSAELPADA
jgi:hypothetical protein